MAHAHALVETGNYRMTHIVAALGVSRSNLTARRDGKHTGRPARYNKAEDLCLLPIISPLCSKRGSNGYRRITARLNRIRVSLLFEQIIRYEGSCLDFSLPYILTRTEGPG